MIRHVAAVTISLIFTTTPVFGQNAITPLAELIVKGAPADVYKSPTVASQVIAKAPGGTVLEIRRNLGSWVEVPWPANEGGVAFLHVNTGTIAPRAGDAAPNGAQVAVAEISAVAAAATSAGAGSSGARSVRPAGSTGTGSRAESYVSLPAHRIGIGALTHAANPSAPGFGATARTWWGHRLGVQFHASRPRIESADGQLITSTQLAPSMLYALPDSVTNNMWLRPYAGAGPRWYRANLATGVGLEAFGGAEATLAGMPQFAISADVGYRWSRPSLDGFTPRRIGFSVSGHWYVK